MSFKQSFRMERIYFEKLKSNIPIIKSLLEQAQTEEARTLLMNSIDVDGAVLLLYRNLGEAWAELADLIQKTQKDLKDLSDRVDQYHDELNEKIDEVNNYLMRLIRALEDRIDVIEQRLDEIRDFYVITGAYDEKTGNSNYHMKHNGERIYLADVNAAITAGRTPIFIYTESVGVKEVYLFCKQSGAGTSVTFESIQTRFNADTSEYETFNGKWTTDGNFIHFSKEDLQLKLTAGDNITISGNVISAGGGSAEYIDLIYDPQTDEPGLYLNGTQVSYSDILDMMEAGKTVYIRGEFPDTTIYKCKWYDDYNEIIYFCSYTYEDGGITYQWNMSIDSSDTIQLGEKYILCLVVTFRYDNGAFNYDQVFDTIYEVLESKGVVEGRYEVYDEILQANVTYNFIVDKYNEDFILFSNTDMKENNGSIDVYHKTFQITSSSPAVVYSTMSGTI